jgi:thiosulfate dehydrogenase [quinone] large subunit
MTKVTRRSTYILTGIAVGLFVLLNWIFADGKFSLNSDVLFSTPDPRDGMEVYSNGTIWTYVLLALIIAAGVYQARRVPDEGIKLEPKIDETTPGQIHDPVAWRLLLGNIFFAVIWMPLRFFVGIEWLAAGEHKIRSDSWMDGGTALKGFWERQLTAPEGGSAPAGTYAWFQDFLQYMYDHEWYTWFAKLIAVGEFLVGIGLVVGALVGITAFFGSFMNINFQLAGVTSSNPVLFALTVFLVLAWKVAGYWGLDRYLLSALGAPWQRGKVFHRGGMTPTVGASRA